MRYFFRAHAGNPGSARTRLACLLSAVGGFGRYKTLGQQCHAPEHSRKELACLRNSFLSMARVGSNQIRFQIGGIDISTKLRGILTD